MLAERNPGELRDSGPVYSLTVKNAADSSDLVAKLRREDSHEIACLVAWNPAKPDYMNMKPAGFSFD